MATVNLVPIDTNQTISADQAVAATGAIFSLTSADGVITQGAYAEVQMKNANNTYTFMGALTPSNPQMVLQPLVAITTRVVKTSNRNIPAFGVDVST